MTFEELLPIIDGKIEVRVADESSAYGYNAFVGMGHSLRQELDAAYLLDYVLKRTVLSCYAAYDGEIFTVIELEGD